MKYLLGVVLFSLVNIPGMIHGTNYSFLSFGFGVGVSYMIALTLWLDRKEEL